MIILIPTYIITFNKNKNDFLRKEILYIVLCVLILISANC